MILKMRISNILHVEIFILKIHPCIRISKCPCFCGSSHLTSILQPASYRKSVLIANPSSELRRDSLAYLMDLTYLVAFSPTTPITQLDVLASSVVDRDFISMTSKWFYVNIKPGRR